MGGNGMVWGNYLGHSNYADAGGPDRPSHTHRCVNPGCRFAYSCIRDPEKQTTWPPCERACSRCGGNLELVK